MSFGARPLPRSVSSGVPAVRSLHAAPSSSFSSSSAAVSALASSPLPSSTPLRAMSAAASSIPPRRHTLGRAGGVEDRPNPHALTEQQQQPALSAASAAFLPCAALSAAELAEWRGASVSALSSREASIRQLAGAKREELRQLVGVRYRVLLETADSIERMKAEGGEAHSDILNIHAALAVLTLHAAPLPPAAGAAAGTAVTAAAASPSPSSLSLLRSLTCAPLTVLQAVRRRQWLSALVQLSESRAAVQRLANSLPQAGQSQQHSLRRLGPDEPSSDASGGVTDTAPSSAAASFSLLHSQAVLQHRSNALSELPSLLYGQAVHALHAEVELDVQVSPSRQPRRAAPLFAAQGTERAK